MPDPGDTAQGDYGQGTGWSKTTTTNTNNNGSSMGFSGGTLNGGNNYSGTNWGGSNTTTTTGNTNYGGSNNSGSSYGFSGGTLNGGNNFSGNNWGGTNTGNSSSSFGSTYNGGNNYTGTNYSAVNSNGGIAGALNAGIGGSYNVSNPISLSSSAGTGYFNRFTPSLPGMNNPSQFDSTINPSNLVNAYGTPMETWSNGYNPNRLTEGAKRIHQAIADASLRRNQPVDYFSGLRPYNPRTGTLQHSLGQAIDIRINDPVTGKPVGYDSIGERAYNPIGDMVGGVRRDIPEMSGPYREFATDALSGFFNNPGVYGNFDNQRWGGAFGGKWGKDYMHFDEGKASSGVSSAQAALRADAAGMDDPSVMKSDYAGHGPLSDPSSTGPITLAMAGMGGIPSPNAPYSNLTQKQDRLNAKQFSEQVPQDPSMVAGARTPGLPFRADASVGLPPGYSDQYLTPATTPEQLWAVQGGSGILAIGGLTMRPPQEVSNVVPSWQQSDYVGPLQTAMVEPDVPVAPSQEGEPIPYPVDENSMGYKLWRGMTYVGDQLLPGGGMMLRTMDDNLKERWPGMTNAERQALIDKWDGNNSYGPSGNSGGNWVSGSGAQVADGGDSPAYSYSTPSVQQTATSAGPEPSSEPLNTEWKQAALAYGFTPEQLKDPEIAAYVKQLFEMGWFG